jgi:hypothetical protein
MSKRNLLEKISNHRKTQYWSQGYAKGYEVGSRESTEFLRQMIIRNLLNDAVIITNADTVWVERAVQIVEES